MGAGEDALCAQILVLVCQLGPSSIADSPLVWGAESEAVALKASESILAINGLGPKNNQQVSLAVDIKAGWIIDISPKDRPSQPDDMIIGGEAVELPKAPKPEGS